MSSELEEVRCENSQVTQGDVEGEVGNSNQVFTHKNMSEERGGFSLPALLALALCICAGMAAFAEVMN